MWSGRVAQGPLKAQWCPIAQHGCGIRGVCLFFKQCISHILPYRTTLGVIGASVQKRSASAKAGHTRPSCTTQSSSHGIVNGIYCPMFHCFIGIAVNKFIKDSTANWTASILVSFMMHSQALREWVHNLKGSKCFGFIPLSSQPRKTILPSKHTWSLGCRTSDGSVGSNSWVYSGSISIWKFTWEHRRNHFFAVFIYKWV